jgi:DedD protein
MEDNDAQLQLKKRARRRLVGAVFFVSLVALVLPMLMDHDPRPPVPDVEIRIPGQDEKPFNPAMVAVPVESPPEKTQPAVESPEAPSARVLETTPAASTAAPVAPRPVDQPVAKAPEKPAAQPVEKKPAPAPVKKAEPSPSAASDEARRAAAILAGQSSAPVATSGAHLILIGAFANEANVVNLRKKLGEQGIKTFTEPLDSPQGRKIRVRAGPFPSREAAEKALVKMKRIGVSGVVAPKP